MNSRIPERHFKHTSARSADGEQTNIEAPNKENASLGRGRDSSNRKRKYEKDQGSTENGDCSANGGHKVDENDEDRDREGYKLREEREGATVDNSDQDREGPVIRQRKGKGGQASGDVSHRNRLHAITLDLSSDGNRTTLAAAQNGFYQDLQSLHVQVKIDNKLKTCSFTEEEAIAITNFFFDDVMGSKAYTRLQRFIKIYTTLSQDGTNQRTVTRAELAACDAALPLQIRKFFSTFARAQQTKSNQNPELAAFRHVQLAMELLQEYNSLREAARKKDKDLIESLLRAGWKPARGVSWTSVVIKCLASEVGMTTTALQNICQSAQGVQTLADHFGAGIICVLPPNTMTR